MSTILGLPANVVYATAAIYALLVIASIIVALLRWKNPGERYSELASRTESWWWMVPSPSCAGRPKASCAR
jgi:phosphatidate cytidylyltransferase